MREASADARKIVKPIEPVEVIDEDTADRLRFDRPQIDGDPAVAIPTRIAQAPSRPTPLTHGHVPTGDRVAIAA